MEAFLAAAALLAGGIYTGIKKAWAYCLAFAAGFFLLVEEALHAVK